MWSLFATWNLTIHTKIVWKRGEIAPKEQFRFYSTIFLLYLYFKEPNYIFICEMWLFDLFFLNSANLICRGRDVSKYFRESLDFEILRVDCMPGRVRGLKRLRGRNIALNFDTPQNCYYMIGPHRIIYATNDNKSNIITKIKGNTTCGETEHMTLQIRRNVIIWKFRIWNIFHHLHIIRKYLM